MDFGDSQYKFQQGLNDQSWGAAKQAQIANSQATGTQAKFQTGLLNGDPNTIKALQQLMGLFGGGGIGGAAGGKGGSGINGGYSGLLNQEIGNIDQMGKGRTNDINQAYHDSSQGALATLSDKGIGGGSFTADAFNGAERNRQSSLNELNDQLLGAKNQAYNTVGVAGVNAQQQQMMAILGPLLQNLLG